MYRLASETIYEVRNNKPVIVEQQFWDHGSYKKEKVTGDTLAVLEQKTESEDSTVDGIKCTSVTQEKLFNDKLRKILKKYAIKYMDELVQGDNNHVCEEVNYGPTIDTYCWFQQELYSYQSDTKGNYIQTTHQKVQDGEWVTTKITKSYQSE